MFPGGFADYSSAGPWVASGVLAGLLLYAIVRALLGIDRRRIADLETANAELDNSRRTAASLSEQAAKLEAEHNRLGAQVSELSPRAQTASLLEQQIAHLQQKDASRQGAVEVASKQIAELQEHVETHSGTAKYYESQYASLFAEHDALAKQSKVTVSDFDRLKAELANAKASLAGTAKQGGELTAAVNEIAALRTELAKAATAAADLTKLRSEFAAAASAHQAEVMQLKSGSQGNASTSASVLEVEASKLRTDLADAKAEIVRMKSAGAAVTPQTGIDPEMYDSDIAALRSTTDDLRKELEDATAEIARLTAASPTTAQGGIDPEMYDSDIAALRSTTNDLRKELSASEAALKQSRAALEQSSLFASEKTAEIQRLQARLSSVPPDVAQYQRLKDALEAANRIAAGLPEKPGP